MTPPQPKEERPVAALLAPDILALLEESPQDVAAETEEMHPANLADIAETLEPEQVIRLLRALPPARAADVLEYMDEDLRTEVLEAMSATQAAALVSEMTPDDRADVIEELEEERADEILSDLPVQARHETEELLAYPPESAGGLMTTEFVSVPEDTLVEDALSSVRAVARAGRREAMYSIYTTDAEGRVRGVLSLRELLAAPEGAHISDLAWTDVVTVPATADREEVARITSKYDLVAVPVVDERGRILGVITVDDVIDAIVEEQTEDVQRLGAVEPLELPYMQTGFFEMLRKRAGWLAALFIGEMLTTIAMQYFEGELARALVLMLFVPLIISSGGNSGSQAASLLIRALALGEVRLNDWWRVAMRELPSGVALGAFLGAIGFVRILLWQWAGWHDYGPHVGLIALTVWFTLIGVVTFGSLTGSLLPFVLRRFGFDPASASAPFVATLVDVTGLSIYFGVALIVLRGTLL
jgi:magnesium transporter